MEHPNIEGSIYRLPEMPVGKKQDEVFRETPGFLHAMPFSDFTNLFGAVLPTDIESGGNLSASASLFGCDLPHACEAFSRFVIYYALKHQFFSSCSNNYPWPPPAEDADNHVVVFREPSSGHPGWDFGYIPKKMDPRLVLSQIDDLACLINLVNALIARRNIKRVYDIGFGSGVFLAGLERASTVDIVGIDNDPEAYVVANDLRKKMSYRDDARVRLIQGDALAVLNTEVIPQNSLLVLNHGKPKELHDAILQMGVDRGLDMLISCDWPAVPGQWNKGGIVRFNPDPYEEMREKLVPAGYHFYLARPATQAGGEMFYCLALR